MNLVKATAVVTALLTGSVAASFYSPVNLVGIVGEDMARGVGNRVRVGVRRQHPAGMYALDLFGVEELVAAHRDAHHRHPAAQRGHGGAEAGVGDDQWRLVQHLGVCHVGDDVGVGGGVD